MKLEETNFDTFSLIYDEKNLISLKKKVRKCECRNCLAF